VFNFSEENLTSSVTATSRAATYTSYVANLNSNNVVAGGASTVTVNVIDQFGNALPAGYQARFLLTGATTGATGNVAATTASNQIVNVVNGVATATLTDNGTGASRTNTYTIDIQKIDTANGGYSGAATGTSNLTFTVNVVANAADVVAGVVTVTSVAATNPVTAGAVNPVLDANSAAVAGQYQATASALSTGDFGAYDARNPLTAPTAAWVTALGTGQAITASVSSKSTSTYLGVSIPSALVTYALAGAEFKATLNSAAVYAKDSITVPSGTAVTVWSNKAGKQTVTITSGAASATVVVTFPAASSANGKTLTIVAPATATPGQTVNFSAKLVDKFGNPVAIATADPLTSSYRLRALALL